MSEWRKIWTNGLPNEGRSPKSGHRMTAEKIRFPGGGPVGTISLHLICSWVFIAAAIRSWRGDLHQRP